MESIAGTVFTGAAAFAATNIDALFLTAALLSAASTRPPQVFAGTFAGIGVLYAASALAALVSLVVPQGAIALLGLIPLAIGLKQLLQRAPGDGPALEAGHGMLAVAGIHIAFGADNLGVYTPLFAASPGDAIALYGVVFALLTAVLCFAANRLVGHPALGAAVRRYGARTVPWVLIALGGWILLGGV
ncbi:MAG TPA: cadmium resistance transporter [Arenimonas sp.]|nr:cadmium resistance transporter [Arenimonas sp.]